MNISIALGEIIRKERNNLGISQEELAYRSGLHRTYIGSVERGERNVTISSLKKIADGLNTNISLLTQQL